MINNNYYLNINFFCYMWTWAQITTLKLHQVTLLSEFLSCRWTGFNSHAVAWLDRFDRQEDEWPHWSTFWPSYFTIFLDKYRISHDRLSCKLTLTFMRICLRNFQNVSTKFLVYWKHNLFRFLNKIVYHSECVFIIKSRHLYLFLLYFVRWVQWGGGGGIYFWEIYNDKLRKP